MDDESLVQFIRRHRWAVLATASDLGVPQAAIIGVAVTERMELIFDTLLSTRKAANLRSNAKVALVIGGWKDDEPKTLQYEGVADVPVGAELERIKSVYFSAFPDGRDRLSWPGITHVRVRPVWLRYSDFSVEPANIEERSFSDGASD
ncbi:MAG: pyridoxamine 5'-phosphate oxidase family protein [Usitatibacteraceae bacterium]